MGDVADIAIVGAGAAGLAAAIFCAQAGRGRRIVLLDGAKKVGAKILVSGGGRCNVTHTQVTAGDFNGPRSIVKKILREFDERRTVEWFESMGVKLKTEETGKLFPVSDDAHGVLDALLRRCEELGVDLRTRHRVAEIAPAAGGFIVRHAAGELRSARAIMATGGRSLPKTGSDGGGWEIVRRLGHSVTPTYPALVPLVLNDAFFHGAVSGVSHEAELSTFAAGKLVDRRIGSLLWTHFGISGPVAMDASRFWVIAQERGESSELRCSFLPGLSFESVEHWLLEAGRLAPKRHVVTLLAERLPRRLAEVLWKYVGGSGPDEIGQLRRDTRRALVHALVALPLPVLTSRGWNHAEVTAGGVPLAEIDPRTMESRIVPGLHLIGEMLDCEGRIGGFNFQWAWATGYIAGRGSTK